MGQTKVNHKMGHRALEMPVTFLWHKSGSTLGFSTLQRAKRMPAVEEFTRNWSQWHCNSPNACLGIFCSSAHKFPHWCHFQGSQQEILKYAEDPRKAEGTEFSKQTTVGNFSTWRGLQGEELHMCEANLCISLGSPGYSKCNAHEQQSRKEKKSRTRSSLASVTTAGMISFNHRIVHLKALLAEEKLQAGSSKTWQQLRSLTAQGGGRVQRLDAKASFSFSQLHILILAKFHLIEYEAQVTSCSNERC